MISLLEIIHGPPLTPCHPARKSPWLQSCTASRTFGWHVEFSSGTENPVSPTFFHRKSGPSHIPPHANSKSPSAPPVFAARTSITMTTTATGTSKSASPSPLATNPPALSQPLGPRSRMASKSGIVWLWKSDYRVENVRDVGRGDITFVRI